MLEISNKQISLNRGSECTITLKVNPKEETEETFFRQGDIVSFAIYEKKKLDNSPLLYKTFNIEENTNIVDIYLTSEDMKIGEYGNKAVEYWYEIELNDNLTIIGFDREGPKKLILYPEGVKNNV